MRNMLAFLAAAVLTFAAVGGYLGWYSVRTTPSENGQRSVTVDFDTKKIGEDLKKAEQKIEKRLLERAAAKNGEAAKPASQAPAVKVNDLNNPFGPDVYRE